MTLRGWVTSTTRVLLLSFAVCLTSLASLRTFQVVWLVLGPLLAAVLAWLAAWIIQGRMKALSPAAASHGIVSDLPDLVDYVSGGLAAGILAVVPLLIVGGVGIGVSQLFLCSTGRCGSVDLVSTEIVVLLAAVLISYGQEVARLIILRCHCHYRAQVPEDPLQRATVTWSKLWAMAAGSMIISILAPISIAGTVTDGSVAMGAAIFLAILTDLALEFVCAVSTGLRLALRDSQAAYWISTNLAFGMETPPEVCGVFTLSETRVLSRAVTFATLTADARRNGADEKQLKALAGRAMGTVSSWSSVVGPAVLLRTITIFLVAGIYVGLAPQDPTLRLYGDKALVSILPNCIIIGLSLLLAVRDWYVHSVDVARGSHQLALQGFCPSCTCLAAKVPTSTLLGDASTLRIVIGGGVGSNGGPGVEGGSEAGEGLDLVTRNSGLPLLAGTNGYGTNKVGFTHTGSAGYGTAGTNVASSSSNPLTAAASAPPLKG